MPKLDPLELLRSAYNKKSQKKTQIKLKGTDLYFDRQAKLPLTTETAWQSPQTGKQFNLGSLWLFLELQSQKIASRPEYFKQVTSLNLDAVGVADADEIVRYFTGEVNETACINAELKNMLAQRAKGRDRPVGDNQGDGQADDKVQKKQKLQNKLDEQTQNELKNIEYLTTYQKPINSKFRCLRYTHKKFINILTHLIENQDTSAQTKPSQSAQGKARIATFYEKRRLPIIIVPEKTIPGNVSLQNIEKFLVKGEYDQYGKLGNPDASKVQIQKILKEKNIIFEVNSRPQLLSQQDWQYVVAIFVIGKDNQFEQWPHKNHKEVFKNCQGYFVKFPKTLIGSTSQWRCQPKVLDPNTRTDDKQIVRSIWRDIEAYLFARV